MKESSALARVALMPLERTTRWGVDRADLLRAAKIDDAQLRDPDARIPLSAIVRLWHAAALHVADPTFGLRLGCEACAREFGLVGYTMAFSGTVSAALTRLARYDRIVSDSLVVHLDDGPEGMWIRIDAEPALQAFRPAADARLAALLSVCREIAAAPIAPLIVHLPYRRPPDVKDYEKFFRAPLEFGAPATALLLSREDLVRPVSCSDEVLIGYLDQLAQQILTGLGAEKTIRDRVRRLLWSSLSDGVPDLEDMARRLAMSPRTLQRRLRDEGTTFAAVLTGFRQDMARPLLRDGRLAVSEVAFLLGYEDPSSFQRAFRRWSGRSPRAFRSAPA
jgi:AraC-like DNA-binding protein